MLPFTVYHLNTYRKVEFSLSEDSYVGNKKEPDTVFYLNVFISTLFDLKS